MRRVLKWTGIAVGAVIGIALVLGVTFYFVGSSKVDRVYDVQTAGLELPTDSAALAHGEHLAEIHGCFDCHQRDLSGKVYVDEPPFRVTATNLTAGRGGVGEDYSVEDFDRVIRHGVKPNGRSVFIMPSAAFHKMSDDDAAALIAYLKQVPPVDNELPPTEVRLPGRILSAMAIDPTSEVRLTRPVDSAPPAGPTAEYGAYLTSMTCAYCHGENLQGVEQPPAPGSPPAPDLRAAGQWPLEAFEEMMRTGVRPSGVEVDPEFMPIAITRGMTDTELEAIHTHLASLAE